jgi:ferredoxin
MTHKITDECIGCGSCEPECAAQAISQDGDKYKINPSKCTDCGACVNVCPVNAVVKE